MVRASSLRIGKALGPDYRLLQLLGKGSLGSVWKALEVDGTPIALKLIPCADATIAAAEIRAIQLIGSVRHPLIAGVDQVLCHGAYVVMLMKPADGSLADLLDVYQTDCGTGIPADDLCPMLSQVATALDYFNARQHGLDGKRTGLQHCNVKPSNLLLFGDTVKLSDFSMWAPVTATVKLPRRVGALDYLAPEVFRGWLTDQSDQFSLAVSYCQLRSGRLPFPKVMPPGTYHLRPSPDLDMLSPPERPIIARALATVPTDRWPSCTEMIERLGRTTAPAGKSSPLPVLN